MNNSISFNTIYNQNRKRVHYHIHALNIRDPEQEFLQIGSIALWQAYRQYEPDKGPMSTYFNCMIRNRLIDQIRKADPAIKHLPAPSECLPVSSAPSLDDLIYTTFTTNHYLLDFVRSQFTYKQWLWFRDHILHDKTTGEIAACHHTTPDAVKSWRHQARKKLNQPDVKATILDEVIN